jgi:glucose/arabinose dehydrogenase
LVLLVTVCAAAFGSAGAAALELVAVARELPQITSITHAGDGSDRLFVTLQGGVIAEVGAEPFFAEPFLDVAPLVSCCGERGLLGLAFHPDYAENGLFFINYTNTEGHTVIARYRVSADPERADPDSGEIIMTVEQPFANHNGGQIKFGPDGYLYIGMGDGGAAGDPLDHGQNMQTLLGALLRIDVDGGSPYAVPADNPFVGGGAREEIWAYGLRNPWRFSFDRDTGDLFIADVGQSAREEVNVQRADSPGGENYGWRLMEGSLCYNPGEGCNDGTLVLPALEYDHSEGCSVTGGYRYRGAEITELQGLYLYSDFCSGRLWGAQDDAGEWRSSELLATGLGVSAFGEDEAGEIYLADYGGGVLYRLERP